MASSLSDPARLEALRAAGLLDETPIPALDRLVRLASKLLRAPVSLVSLVDDRRQFFTSQVGLEEPWAAKRETPLSHSFCQYVVTSGADLIVEDARQHPLVKDNLAIRDLHVIAYAGVPITEENGWILGSMCVIDSRPRTWSADELAVLRDLARSVESEIRLRTLGRMLKERNDLLEGILACMEESVIVADPQGKTLVYNDACRRMFARPAADTTSPADWVADFGLFLSNGQPFPPEQIPLVRAMFGESVRNVEIVVRTEAHPDGRVHSVNACPLKSGSGNVIGAITVGRDVTELRQALDAVTRVSIHDELTGLLNRRGFRELAAQSLRIADRSRKGLALFYFDLNDMKPINDKLGHETGDVALTAFTAVLRSTFRQSDVIARLGGDEFAAIALDCASLQAVEASLARVQEKIAAFNAPGTAKFRLSASTGFALYDPSHARSLDAVIAEADLSMYAQKQLRRTHGSGEYRMKARKDR